MFFFSFIINGSRESNNKLFLFLFVRLYRYQGILNSICKYKINRYFIYSPQNPITRSHRLSNYLAHDLKIVYLSFVFAPFSTLLAYSGYLSYDLHWKLNLFVDSSVPEQMIFVTVHLLSSLHPNFCSVLLRSLNYLEIVLFVVTFLLG